MNRKSGTKPNDIFASFDRGNRLLALPQSRWLALAKPHGKWPKGNTTSTDSPPLGSGWQHQFWGWMLHANQAPEALVKRQGMKWLTPRQWPCRRCHVRHWERPISPFWLPQGLYKLIRVEKITKLPKEVCPGLFWREHKNQLCRFKAYNHLFLSSI